ncbi:MAG TPA: DUF3567 domain-containing protein [Ideonella sp.]|jgi:hypothetical protein|nr:DUF3567 domain-containing protein [Ideonella sp.]
MNLVYNSDSFAVVQISLEAGSVHEDAAEPRGGYEIVDKLAKKGIYIDGALAQRFREGVQALAAKEPSTEDIDEYIAGYTELAQQPLTLH